MSGSPSPGFWSKGLSQAISSDARFSGLIFVQGHWDKSSAEYRMFMVNSVELGLQIGYNDRLPS